MPRQFSYLPSCRRGALASLECAYTAKSENGGEWGCAVLLHPRSAPHAQPRAQWVIPFQERGGKNRPAGGGYRTRVHLNGSQSVGALGRESCDGTHRVSSSPNMPWRRCGAARRRWQPASSAFFATRARRAGKLVCISVTNLFSRKKLAHLSVVRRRSGERQRWIKQGWCVPLRVCTPSNSSPDSLRFTSRSEAKTKSSKHYTE